MSESTETQVATTSDEALARISADLYPQDVSLDLIQTDTITNYRKVGKPVDSLAQSIFAGGLLQSPICVVLHQTDDEGDYLVDEDGEAILEECHVVAGFRRIQALRLLRDKIEAHNDAVSDGSITEQEANGYWFLNDDDSVMTEEVDFKFDILTIKVREAEALDSETLAWATRMNLIENVQREDLNLADEIDGVCAMLGQGLTQGQAARDTGRSQPTVSQYLKVKSKAIPAVLDSIRTGKLTLAKALIIAKQTNPKGKPDKRAQQKSLEALINRDKDAEKAIKDKTKTRQTLKDIINLTHDLDNPDTFGDADPARKAAIRDAFAWLFCGCDTNALIYGLREEIDLTANLPEQKPEKEKGKGKGKAKKAKAKAKAKASAKPKVRRRPARKKAAAETAEEEVAEEVVEDEGVEEEAIEEESEAPAEIEAEEVSEAPAAVEPEPAAAEEKPAKQQRRKRRRRS